MIEESLSTIREYNRIPYVSGPFSQSHPDRLAAHATLYGLEPPPVVTARVLEIGCGDGGNLIPMAVALPDGRFVGIDGSDAALSLARDRVARLGLRNIKFVQADICDLPLDGELFDYVISHGVYSWVPAHVREALLALVARSLTPEGIAYISYNTLPGCFARTIIRDLCLFHTNGVEDPRDKIKHSREIVEFISTNCIGGRGYAELLESERSSIKSREEGFVYHDELSPTFHCVYFQTFVEHANNYGLSFICEADYRDMWESLFPEEVFEKIDPVSRQQYLDFLRGRRFRQSLLCLSNRRPDIKARASNLEELCFSSRSKILNESPDPEGAMKVRIIGNTEITLTDEVIELNLARRILQLLDAQWPDTATMENLIEAGVGGSGLNAALLLLYGLDAIEIHTVPRRVRRTDERPVADQYARLMAGHSRKVTSCLLHQYVELSSPQQRILLALDGTRGLDEVLAELHDSSMSYDQISQEAARLWRHGLLAGAREAMLPAWSDGVAA